MARYADFRYGSRLYGNTPKAVSRSFILAQAVDYSRVLLTLDVEERLGAGFVITRTRTGAAEDPSNGVIVASDVFDSPVYQFIDGEGNYEDDTTVNDVAVPSGMVYYTLFIFGTDGSWFRDAATSLIVPEDRRTQYQMAINLPRAYSSADGNPISPTDMGTPLMRFLGGLAVSYDEWATALDLVTPSTSRARGIIRRLHEAYATSVGMPVESTIGIASSSRLFRDSGLIYKQKGTLAGVRKYVEALTNWDAIVTESPNLFLSLDDASFETGVGNWGTTGGTLESATVNGGSVTAPEMEFEDPLNAFPAEAVGRVTLSSSSCTLTLPADESREKSIPVTAGSMYYIKIPVRKISGSPVLTAKIQWADQQGSDISLTTVANITPTTSWSTLSDNVSAPSGAAFAKIVLVVSGSNTNSMDIDMLSFCAEDTHYRDPRSVDVICGPTRVNLLSDPSFEGSGYWTQESGSFSRDTDEHFLGLKSALCEGEYRVVSEIIPELPNYPISLSGYSKGEGTGSYVFEFLDANDDVLSTQEIAAPAGESWDRLDATVLPDPDATKFRLVLSGDGTIYYDALSLERADRPLIYFDGSISDQSGEDSKYATVGGHVYSLLYPNRLVKLIRLRQTLPFYLPMGVTARVLLWDSPDPNVQDLLPYGV